MPIIGKVDLNTPDANKGIVLLKYTYRYTSIYLILSFVGSEDMSFFSEIKCMVAYFKSLLHEVIEKLH